jgi:hypothetical protein
VILAASGGAGTGLIGFLVVVCLVVASVLLFRSMNRRIRRVRERALAAQAESGQDGGPAATETRQAGPPGRGQRRSSIADAKAWQAEHSQQPGQSGESG